MPNYAELYALKFKNEKNSKNFEYLYNQTKGILYGFAKRFLTEQDDVDDVVSNSYVTIWEKIHQFEPQKGTFVSWCFIIVRNECLWIIDKNNKYPTESIDINESDENNIKSNWEIYNSEKPSWEFFDDIESKVNLEEDLLNKTLELIDEIPDLWRDYLIERHFSNLSMDELAKKFNVCENTAKTRLRHGRIWLKNAWLKKYKKEFAYENY